MQTIKQAEIVRISTALTLNMDLPKSVTDLCAKRILDGNYDKIPLQWRQTQKEIVIYFDNCTISYDTITGELVKCPPSNMDLYLKNAIVFCG